MSNVTIQLSPEEAQLFLKFQEHYQLIAYILGVMDGLNVTTLKTCELTMNFNNAGMVTHTSITKHFREEKLSTVAHTVGNVV